MRTEAMRERAKNRDDYPVKCSFRGVVKIFEQCIQQLIQDLPYPGKNVRAWRRAHAHSKAVRGLGGVRSEKHRLL